MYPEKRGVDNVTSRTLILTRRQCRQYNVIYLYYITYSDVYALFFFTSFHLSMCHPYKMLTKNRERFVYVFNSFRYIIYLLLTISIIQQRHRYLNWLMLVNYFLWLWVCEFDLEKFKKDLKFFPNQFVKEFFNNNLSYYWKRAIIYFEEMGITSDHTNSNFKIQQRYQQLSWWDKYWN